MRVTWARLPAAEQIARIVLHTVTRLVELSWSQWPSQLRNTHFWIQDVLNLLFFFPVNALICIDCPFPSNLGWCHFVFWLVSKWSITKDGSPSKVMLFGWKLRMECWTSGRNRLDVTAAWRYLTVCSLTPPLAVWLEHTGRDSVCAFLPLGSLPVDRLG